MIDIRAYQVADAPSLWDIFYQTVRTINRRDYTQEQVMAWASDDITAQQWQLKMDAISPFVATRDDEIVGYADLQQSGLIDHFFCHHAYQQQGVGRCLMEHIISIAKNQDIPILTSNVSITARPFFEHFGFEVVKKQFNQRRDQEIINFRMQKNL